MFSLSLAGTDGDFAVLNFTVRECPMLLRDRRTSTAAPSRTERPLAEALGNSSGLWQRNMIPIRNIFYINFYL